MSLRYICNYRDHQFPSADTSFFHFDRLGVACFLFLVFSITIRRSNAWHEERWRDVSSSIILHKNRSRDFCHDFSQQLGK